MIDAETNIASRNGVNKLRGARDEVHPDKVRQKQYEPFRPRGAQEVPPALAQRFANEGYHLHWVRVIIEGDIDTENLADAYHKGYEPVDVADIPDNVLKTLKVSDVAGFKGLIVSKDTGLFKIPQSRYDEIRNYYRGIAESQIQGVHAQIRESAKMHGLDVKLYDESKSTFATGENSKKVAIQQDGND
jgi:hypothetical protein